MKKYILILLLVMGVIFLVFCLTSYSQEYDFRQTNWGMNEEQVKAIENKEIAYEGNNSLGHVLSYEVDINNKNYYCIYYFLEEKLYTAGYMSKEEYTNKNDYIRDYKEIKELLTKKYGKIDQKRLLELYDRTEIYWENDLFKDNEGDWGLAISVGDLSYGSIWETIATKIELILDGNNYEINLRVRYISKELKEWADKIKEEKAKANF